MTKMIMTGEQIDNALTRMAFEILEKNVDEEEICLVGIQRRGVNIAKILLEKLTKNSKKNIKMGILDITFYRDDLSTISHYPVVNGTDIHFPIDKKTIVLVDDVLYTGRTIRAAIDGLFEFGRPKKVELAVLVDRGHREIPFSPDYVGKNVPTAKSEIIKVMVEEIDGKDQVEIINSI
jgi:pyrimidine operon attenuation protein/uracil phosphoribosyltransferase